MSSSSAHSRVKGNKGRGEAAGNVYGAIENEHWHSDRLGEEAM